MTEMFGLIVSGRLVQTDFTRPSETQFLTNLGDAENINHIVIFLTGSQPFPENYGGSIFFSWPEPNSPPSWHLLGHISNKKPSVIFKISGIKRSSSGGMFVTNQQASNQAQVGIAVELLTEQAAQVPAVSTEASTVTSYVEFSKAMCENLYNYVSSFAQLPNQIVPSPNEQYLPLSVLTRWYETFSRRLQHNPNFWKS